MTTPARYADYGSQFAAIYDDIFPRENLTEADTAWLASQIPSGTPRILELGVGTGRVALPLWENLTARGDRPAFVGIDVSAEMLQELAAHDSNHRIERRQADIASDDLGEDEYDTILCLCATISMLTEADDQQAAFQAAATALKPGGHLIVETHNGNIVQAMNPQGSGVYAVPYGGGKRILVTFSELRGNQWSVEHCWIDNSEATFATEHSRVTTLDELDAYATAAGLTPHSHTAGLAGAPITGNEPTVCATYIKSA
jgi:SAM-dependent methyltransferase